MLQLRDRNSPEKRWFNPQRDMVWAIPSLVKQALVRLDTYSGTPEYSREEFCESCRQFGKLVQDINSGEFFQDLEVMGERLEGISPKFWEVTGPEFFKLTLLSLVRWVEEISPKDETDPEWDISALLRQIDERFTQRKSFWERLRTAVVYLWKG